MGHKGTMFLATKRIDIQGHLHTRRRIGVNCRHAAMNVRRKYAETEIPTGRGLWPQVPIKCDLGCQDLRCLDWGSTVPHLTSTNHTDYNHSRRLSDYAVDMAKSSQSQAIYEMTPDELLSKYRCLDRRLYNYKITKASMEGKDDAERLVKQRARLLGRTGFVVNDSAVFGEAKRRWLSYYNEQLDRRSEQMEEKTPIRVQSYIPKNKSCHRLPDVQRSVLSRRKNLEHGSTIVFTLIKPKSSPRKVWNRFSLFQRRSQSPETNSMIRNAKKRFQVHER